MCDCAGHRPPDSCDESSTLDGNQAAGLACEYSVRTGYSTTRAQDTLYRGGNGGGQQKHVRSLAVTRRRCVTEVLNTQVHLGRVAVPEVNCCLPLAQFVGLVICSQLPPDIVFDLHPPIEGQATVPGL